MADYPLDLPTLENWLWEAACKIRIDAHGSADRVFSCAARIGGSEIKRAFLCRFIEASLSTV